MRISRNGKKNLQKSKGVLLLSFSGDRSDTVLDCTDQTVTIYKTMEFSLGLKLNRRFTISAALSLSLTLSSCITRYDIERCEREIERHRNEFRRVANVSSTPNFIVYVTAIVICFILDFFPFDCLRLSPSHFRQDVCRNSLQNKWSKAIMSDTCYNMQESTPKYTKEAEQI